MSGSPLLPCCDLLSNFVSLIFCYIRSVANSAWRAVVICFQILYLWYSVTSQDLCNEQTMVLWFAFKFCIFDILLHLSTYIINISSSCDLLSNFVSLIFCYIWLSKVPFLKAVVICFQILYLWYSVTSKGRDMNEVLALWFAFKFCIFDILLHRTKISGW